MLDHAPLQITGVSSYVLPPPARPARVPVIAVDTLARPDVAGLRARIRWDGVVWRRCVWRADFDPPKARLMLEVRIATPDMCRFRLQFDLPAERELVRAVIRAPRVVIATTPLDQCGRWDDTVSLHLYIGDVSGIVKKAIARADGWAGST